MKAIYGTLPIGINLDKCRPSMESTRAHLNVTTCVMKTTRLQTRNYQNHTRKTYIRSDYIKKGLMHTLAHTVSECKLTICTRSKVGLKYHTNQFLVTAG